MGDSHLEEASLGRIYEDLLFTVGRLLSDPKTDDLLEELQPSMKAIKAAQASENDARDRHVLAQGKTTSVEVRAEEVLNPLYLDVQKITGKLHDNQAPLAQLLFPGGLTAAKERSGAEMQKDVERMHDAIATSELAAGLKEHLRPLAALGRAFDKPLEELGAAESALTLAQRKSDQVRSGALDARAVLRGILDQRYPRQPRRVASFFRKSRRARSKTAASEKKKAAEEKKGAAPGGKDGSGKEAPAGEGEKKEQG